MFVSWGDEGTDVSVLNPHLHRSIDYIIEN